MEIFSSIFSLRVKNSKLKSQVSIEHFLFFGAKKRQKWKTNFPSPLFPFSPGTPPFIAILRFPTSSTATAGRLASPHDKFFNKSEINKWNLCHFRHLNTLFFCDEERGFRIFDLRHKPTVGFWIWIRHILSEKKRVEKLPKKCRRLRGDGVS